MPGRIRQVPAAAVAAGNSSELPYIPGLHFNEALTWRAGKAIPVADLLTRLQALSTELRRLEQDQVDRTAFTKVAQDLASANLLGHKDKGIRAYVACCVVDILRLCAPDAPFKNAQLKVGMEPRTVRSSTDPTLGHLYDYHHFHTTMSGEPFRRLQRTTCLRP